MNTQFKKGVLEICVLALIHKKDMYGYEIVQNISKVIEVNEGTIYPIQVVYMQIKIIDF